MKAQVTLLLIFLTCAVSAQSIITGRVTDRSGEALIGVNVYLEGTYDGATTDIDGRFSFETYKSDSLRLIATSIGYHKSDLLLGETRSELTIELREEINELNAVVITAGSFNAAEGSKQEVLRPLDVVTTAGATADVPGALNTLPGTQTVGETGRLFVRGGEGRETKTFIDGMLVHNEYSPSAPNTPSRSRFSPFMFKGTNFTTGGYSAEYGQALSSALILDSKDIAEVNRTDLSLMTVGVDASTTQSFTNSSVAGKVQYTNLTPYFALVDQNLKWDKAPEYIN
ncbi:MAG: carboxypeptidase-like regulatory domain-containing protein [Bacteroidota bacterium]